VDLGIVVAFTVTGAVLGVATGFVVYKITVGAGMGGNFIEWAFPGHGYVSNPEDALAWTIGGAIVGAAVGYIRGRNSK